MRAHVHPEVQKALLTQFMDWHFLSTLDADLRNLLGDTYDVIQRRDLREQRTKGIEARHRLAVLLDLVQKHQAGIRNLPLSLLATIGELNSTRNLLAKSQNDPLWNKLISGLKNPDEYPHTLILLGLADLFRRGDCDVVLVREASGGRMCDIRLVAPDGEHVNIEVKTPRELLWPLAKLTPGAARRQVARLFHKTGTSSGGQLPPDAPGLLVIGGFSLDQRTHDVFEAAARHYLDRPPGDYSHIIGVLFSWIGTVMTPADARLDGNKFTMETLIAAKTANYLIENPRYEGRFFIRMV